MEDKIIQESIKCLQKEGLRFSVDTLADNLKISKKTIYKYFPDKEALALALYQSYYADAMKQAESLVNSNTATVKADLLKLYFNSKMMMRSEIFNKYKLNETVFAYACECNDALWRIISANYWYDISDEDITILKIIIDGAFEKLCNAHINPDKVIERLVQLL